MVLATGSTTSATAISNSVIDSFEETSARMKSFDGGNSVYQVQSDFRLVLIQLSK